jgi:hypothetical protein
MKTLLHIKSYLDCTTESDIQQHDKEVISILSNIIENNPNGIITKTTFHNSKITYRYTPQWEIDSIGQNLDIKNGIDFAEDNTIYCYGNTSNTTIEYLTANNNTLEEIEELETIQEVNQVLSKYFI